MVIFFYCFFSAFLMEMGFLFLMTLFVFYFLFNFFYGFSMSSNFFFDCFSFIMVFLSILVFFLMLISGFVEVFNMNLLQKVMVLFLFLFLGVFSLFLVSSITVFYLMFEFTVVPTFILILSWGYGVDRMQASIYLFLYTFFSSLPFLLILLKFFSSGMSFFFSLHFLSFNLSTVSSYWWLFMLFVFLVKLPIFMLHLWLPKAHVEASLVGSMLLAGILLKLGGYGIYKMLTYFFLGMLDFYWWFLSFPIFGGILMGFICIRQVDIKSMVAFSSVVHMGPVLSSLSLINMTGLMGSYFMMVSHGLCSSCLFFLVNISYMLLGSRSYFIFRGGMFFSSIFIFFWFFFCMFNMGLPPSFNFFSELFLISSFMLSTKFILFLLIFLFMISSFYNVLMHLIFNFGSSKLFFLFFIGLNMKNFLLLFLSIVLISIFIFYMSFFSC